VERGERPSAGEEILFGEQIRAERLMLGLRTSLGIDKALIAESEGWEEVLGELVDRSLVRLVGDRIVPTDEGLLVADRLPLLFM
jgi:hypothetical protein